MRIFRVNSTAIILNFYICFRRCTDSHITTSTVGSSIRPHNNSTGSRITMFLRSNTFCGTTNNDIPVFQSLCPLTYSHCTCRDIRAYSTFTSCFCTCTDSNRISTLSICAITNCDTTVIYSLCADTIFNRCPQSIGRNHNARQHNGNRCNSYHFRKYNRQRRPFRHVLCRFRYDYVTPLCTIPNYFKNSIHQSYPFPTELSVKTSSVCISTHSKHNLK